MATPNIQLGIMDDAPPSTEEMEQFRLGRRDYRFGGVSKEVVIFLMGYGHAKGYVVSSTELEPGRWFVTITFPPITPMKTTSVIVPEHRHRLFQLGVGGE